MLLIVAIIFGINVVFGFISIFATAFGVAFGIADVIVIGVIVSVFRNLIDDKPYPLFIPDGFLRAKLLSVNSVAAANLKDGAYEMMFQETKS